MGSNTYTTSGSWLCPSGVTSITVECWGSGGNSGASGVLPLKYGGGGGGGGGYSKASGIATTPGNTYNFTIGTAGGATNTYWDAGAACLANFGVNGSNGTAGPGGVAGVGNVLTVAGGAGANGAAMGRGGGGGGCGNGAAGNASAATGGAGANGGGNGGNGGASRGLSGSPGNPPGGGGGGNGGYVSGTVAGSAGQLTVSWTDVVNLKLVMQITS